jgi:Zn-dependent peptidase ImmA (M78 family)
VTLRRGFRAEAEGYAASIRAELDLKTSDPIDLAAVADLTGVRVVSADRLVDRERLVELERIQAFAFSACTFDIDGSKVIVLNPLRSRERQTSDTAHELAHVLLKHDLTEIRELAGMPFRTCRSDQEEEATTLGGTLLLPRPLLLRAAKKGMEIEDIAVTYRVTLEMARFRYNTSGIARQFSAPRRAGSRQLSR